MATQSKTLSDLLIIGVMTGNSMDAADAVLTRFAANGDIEDLCHYSVPYPPPLYDALFALRNAVNNAKGNIQSVAKNFQYERQTFQDIHDDYVSLIVNTIKDLINKARQDQTLIDRFGKDFDIHLIGNHGQNLAHFPPSIAGDDLQTYTVQIGDGQMIADFTGIPTAYDFRSDDIINGGEGAPLAPYHHEKLAESVRQNGHLPICFCNAGNTGNLSVITKEIDSDNTVTYGWDAGPFNYFPDQLMRREKNQECDIDGQIGKTGAINLPLLQRLFDTSVVDNDEQNYLLQAPPKSSDGEWYHLIPEMMGTKDIEGAILPFETRLRTASYFSVYLFVHSLGLLPSSAAMPHHFALCGGGWKNPLMSMHFRALLNGGTDISPILPEHDGIFQNVFKRLKDQDITVEHAQFYGFDPDMMEARIFAHAAMCLIKKEAFTRKSITNVQTPTICGRFALPDTLNISPNLQQWMTHFKFEDRFKDKRETRWSRAARNFNE